MGFFDLTSWKLHEKRRNLFATFNIKLPYYTPHQANNADTIISDGKEKINFSGYNYLGLAHHPEVIAASVNATRQYGTSVCASRIVSGQIPLHEQLEKAIADFLGTDDALAFISGYGTNVSIIGHIMGRKDMVIHDDFAHNSIVTGCQLSQAKRRTYKHNNWDELEALLQRKRHLYQQALLVIEGIYSMDGDIPDFNKIIALKKKYDLMIMVDEAHSIGVLGKSGRGIGELFQLKRDDIDIWMGTLSKSFASSGGYVAASADMIDFLKYTAPGFLFSVGLPPSQTAAALKALEIIKKEPLRIQRLHQNARYFHQQALQHNFDIGVSLNTPIIPIHIGDSKSCLAISAALFEQGIHVLPVIAPAVPEGKGRLRFFISQCHSKAQIDRAIAALDNILKENKVA